MSSDKNTPQPQGDASPCPECEVKAVDVGPSESDFATPQYEAGFKAGLRFYEEHFATPQVSGGGDALQALAAKWREQGQREHKFSQEKEWAEWVRDRHHGASGAFSACALELEAALTPRAHEPAPARPVAEVASTFGNATGATPGAITTRIYAKDEPAPTADGGAVALADELIALSRRCHYQIACEIVDAASRVRRLTHPAPQADVARLVELAEDFTKCRAMVYRGIAHTCPAEGGAVYQYKHPGETGWTDCAPEAFQRFVADPEYSTRTLYTHPAPQADVALLVEAATLMREAAAVLLAVSESSDTDHLPACWRWPLLDELVGSASILTAPPEGATNGQ